MLTLPAIYLTKDKVAETIADLDKVGVQKILALRGDIIPGVEPQKDFRYATDLIEFITEQAPHFDIVGACYPEGHPDSPNQISDIQNLKKKVDAGCSSLVTQLFLTMSVSTISKTSVPWLGLMCPFMQGSCQSSTVTKRFVS